MIGSWRAQQTGDRALVERVVGEPYPLVATRAESLRATPDVPLLDQVQDEWYVVAREDSWTLISPALSADDVTQYQDAAIDVLTAPNPVLEIDPKEQWLAGWKGISRPHSGSLRRGLSESAALMAANDRSVLGTTTTSGEFARLLVRRVLDAANKDQTYLLWSSLTDVVSLLAEAAPLDFLSAIRAGLVGESPLHRQMFRDSKETRDFFGPSSPHTQLLAALEILAWSPDFIDEVVLILVSLDALDPGGALSNRPRASLLGILSLWCPQTDATFADRIRCIELVAEHSHRGFEILLDLIPDGHPVQMSHSAPIYRDWGLKVRPALIEVKNAISSAASLLLNSFDVNSARAIALIDRLDDFDSGFRLEFAEKLSTSKISWSQSELVAVFESLRSFIAKHEEFADTEWSLQHTELEPLKYLRDSLQPSDPKLKHRWLFGQGWVTLGDTSRRDDFAAYEAELSKRRQAAIEEIFATGGVAAIIEFSANVDGWLVGVALGASTSPAVDAEILVLLDSNDFVRPLAAGYFSARLLQSGRVPRPTTRRQPLSGNAGFSASIFARSVRGPQ